MLLYDVVLKLHLQFEQAIPTQMCASSAIYPTPHGLFFWLPFLVDFFLLLFKSASHLYNFSHTTCGKV